MLFLVADRDMLLAAREQIYQRDEQTDFQKQVKRFNVVDGYVARKTAKRMPCTL